MIPVPAIVGAIAALGYVAYDSMKKPPKGAAAPQIPPILNQIGQPRKDVVTASQPVAPGAPPARIEAKEGEKLMPVPKVIMSTPAGNPIISITPINPDTGKSTVSNQVATNGLAMNEAHQLYDYLVANPPKTVNQSAEFSQNVLEFQKAHNTDPNAKMTTGGKLTEDGKYDLSTSAALAVYTGTPIPPVPNMPIIPQNVANANGPAALTGSNLYAYLKTHKNDRNDKTLKELIRSFQQAVNTDKKFPGPALEIAGVKYPNVAVIKKPLVVDGIYGKGTSDALAVITFERINP